MVPAFVGRRPHWDPDAAERSGLTLNATSAHLARAASKP
jgi:glycerol kinase